MLINHRQSAYVDNDELERAAGMMEIRAHELENEEPHEAGLWMAGAAALRLMQRHDLREARDLVVLFEAKVRLELA